MYGDYGNDKTILSWAHVSCFQLKKALHFFFCDLLILDGVDL